MPEMAKNINSNGGNVKKNKYKKANQDDKKAL